MGVLETSIEWVWTHSTWFNILLVLAVIVALSVSSLYSTHQRLPNVPYLQMSKLPGAAGIAADIRAFVNNGSVVMQIGYEKFSKHGQSYLMRTPLQTVFVAAPHLIEEIRSANDEYLNPIAANNIIMQLRHTLHPEFETDQYQLEVARKPLMQSLGPGLPGIIDEAKSAFHDDVGEPTEWKTMAMYPLGFRIVTRTANRLLFGKELCTNEEFLKLSMEYATTCFGGADLVRNYPEILKPIIMYFKTNLYSDLAMARKHLVPIIKERLQKMDEYETLGEMDKWFKIKPQDSMQWVLDITPPNKRNPKILAYRMMHVNVSAVHTSSVTYVDAMYDLASRPEIHDELREEITRVFAEEGNQWRKQGLTKLVKMDSFMKESLRHKPLFAGQLDRIVVKDYTLADGTLLPKGTYITVPSYAMYNDNDNYPDAAKFDPWRFSKLRETPGQETLHSFVQTTPTFLHFGHGKHACPGRFFASNEIKVLLVYTLMNYDIRIPDGTSQLPSLWYSKSRVPNPNGQVCWRYRKGGEIYSTPEFSP